MSTETRTCLAKGCDGTVTFDKGAGSSLRGQPLRHHAACPNCGADQYLTESGHHGLVR